MCTSCKSKRPQKKHEMEYFIPLCCTPVQGRYLSGLAPALGTAASSGMQLGVDLGFAWQFLESEACQAAIKSPSLASIIGCAEWCRYTPETKPYSARFSVGVSPKLFLTEAQGNQIPGWNYVDSPTEECVESENPAGECSAGAPSPAPAPG